MNGAARGQPGGAHFIETHQPHLALVGHIHEGRGMDRIGRTVS